MPNQLEISLSPERLDEGAPEERATFGLLAIRIGEVSLSEGFDSFLNGSRSGPLVAGYYAAEWFAWNWWRLFHEPRATTPEWGLAHAMPSIGEGYIWPNVTIFSDGQRTILVPVPSPATSKPFRFVATTLVVVPSTQFASALDIFVSQMVERVRVANLRDTNLERLWRDVTQERDDPGLSKFRRLQALLGRDADEGDELLISHLIADSEEIGQSAVEELAAESGSSAAAEEVPRASKLREFASANGFIANRDDWPELETNLRSEDGRVAAWKFGNRAAQSFRETLGFGKRPLSNSELAAIVRVPGNILSDSLENPYRFSYALSDGGDGRSSRIVFRSRWETGRRFDLARLIGDFTFGDKESLQPVTRASTYRQKAQRAFAAEFLSPFSAVEEMLDGDYSEEQQSIVADHFNVSPLAIDTMLRNHGLLPRDQFAAIADPEVA